MLFPNRLPEHGQALLPRDAAIVDAAAARQVQTLLAACPRYRATPLHVLPALAAELGIAGLQIKDEASRLGLGSFKALGGVHAVIRLVLEAAESALGRMPAAAELLAPAVRALAGRMTFACASAGNHGRAVAAGARLTGAKAVVFVPQDTAEARVRHLRDLGAWVEFVAGTYDDAVAAAARRCAEEGWILVSDTAWPGYERIPGLVMQGYTAIAEEIMQVSAEPPTHVFLQAGVGGFAGAMAGYFAQRFGASAPKIIVVEPERAACFFASQVAGEASRIRSGPPTVMAMLACYEPSLVAWRILARVADAFMTVADEHTLDAMRRLAASRAGDPVIVSAASGAAGFAGLCAVAADPVLRNRIGLGPHARVLAINTEGAVDLAAYGKFMLASLDLSEV